ncbi:glycosyltransferase family 2 protein [Aliiroseovarius sp. KMU-50]|uniref:Glycosyltransferase family 2 protein n=1 Tax=Aliiroseovarius salicola TaxID=3009082 RepID=A0ABT4W0C0_9RHOB|nr:glycosyltransferase family 2 protein [Aliiroseovarius sp. KMU-50]MDA5093243.1 glycosyltransferase family 2 protein [Aliiroseovarius sp. KMU-50]
MKGTLAFTTIRNEGPFLLEWIAWQKMLGFERVLVMFNDCTDHSPQMLRLLAKAGEIGIKRHHPTEGEHPQPSAYRACRSHPYVKEATWMFTCDVDEFLVVHKGDGTIRTLLENGNVPWRGMGINWRIFGTNSHNRWEDGLVHRKFLRSSPSDVKQNSCVKSFVKDPLEFGMLRSHTPRFWNGQENWGSGGNYWVLSNGERWPIYNPDSTARNATEQPDIVHGDASVHHYILQTREQFEFKRGRLSAAEGLDRYNEDFFGRFNHNSTPNRDALEHKARFDTEYARICAIPGVMRLHHLSCADLVAEMCEKRGDDPKDDPRWQHHRTQAQSLPRQVT